MTMNTDLYNDALINKAICESHYLAAGWQDTPVAPVDVMSDNFFAYPCLLTDKKLYLLAPVALEKQEVKKLMSGHKPKSIELTLPEDKDTPDTGVTRFCSNDLECLFARAYRNTVSETDFKDFVAGGVYFAFKKLSIENKTVFRALVQDKLSCHFPVLYIAAEDIMDIRISFINNNQRGGTIATAKEVITSISIFNDDLALQGLSCVTYPKIK